jgi:translocation and assembly module TamB
VRVLAAALRFAGFALLGLAAIAGVLVSAVTLFATSSPGRRIVAREVIRLLDGALAGSFELAEIAVRPSGVEIRGLRVLDPDGHLVLAVDRASVSIDQLELRGRTVGVSAALDGPAVLLEEEEGGGLSLARAFAPAHPAPPRAKPPSPAKPREPSGDGFRVRVTALAIRGGSVWWGDSDGATRLEARDVNVDARGAWGPSAAEVELRLRGALDLPVAAPVSVDALASRNGDRVRVPLLRADVGGTAVSLVGDVNARTLAGRAALTRLDVARAGPTFVPQVGAGADLAGPSTLNRMARS